MCPRLFYLHLHSALFCSLCCCCCCCPAWATPARSVFSLSLSLSLLLSLFVYLSRLFVVLSLAALRSFLGVSLVRSVCCMRFICLLSRCYLRERTPRPIALPLPLSHTLRVSPSLCLPATFLHFLQASPDFGSQKSIK